MRASKCVIVVVRTHDKAHNDDAKEELNSTVTFFSNKIDKK
jgi:hypothetical protein